jgi:PAS domain S-box-containing protein
VSGIPSGDDTGRSGLILRRITLATGLITAVIGGLGLVGFALDITIFTSLLPGYKSIAVSAALIWIFLGLVLVHHATRPPSGKLVLMVRAVIAGIVIIEAIELPLSLMGSHSLIERLSVQVGSVLLGSPTTPISPAASAMIIPSGIALFVLLAPAGTEKRNRQIQDAAGMIGLAVGLMAFTLVLSYVYGAPLLYDTKLIPIAFPSALAGFIAGSGIVAAAGPEAIPLKYFTGSSTRARLLRIFVPFVIVLTLAQNILFLVISDVFRVQDALLLSICIVVFGSVTALVIARFSGRIGSDLEQAEEELVRRNEDLAAMNEEITAISEELRQNNEELLRRNEDLNAAYEELTATQEELQQSNEELIRSEQELRKTSQYLENLINYANAPIVVWDPHYVITRFNHAFEELTGRTAREIIGQRLEVLFPQQYLDASMEIIRKTMKGERLKIVEIPILNREGEIRIVLWNSATLFEPDGITIQSTIAQGNDITERKITEAELEERNEELNSAIEELTKRGHELNEALKEKEVLLSEVHHRVKNNLTAFISLLSLESAYDDSPAGLALKKDLQNRARSMALIHETLYRTKTYSRVNMDVYLSTLVGQVVQSYESAKSIKTSVDAHGITLDLSRATPGGLIINELLTNSLKYAFPPSFDCESIRGTSCMIGVSLTEDDGAYILTIRDNGIGLPGDLDIATTKTLGLKLVNFLAKHQLRASIEVHPEEGAEFRFRFRDKV